jgi:glycerol-3-phosphate acyltransferase PlsY
MTAFMLCVLTAYLLGSVSGSLLLGRLRQVDIRTLGSGNAGGTNALRTQGWKFALGVVLIDVGKGALAAGVVPGMAPLFGGAQTELLGLCCGVAAVVGHCFPAWHGFRGGKGAATSIGALLVIHPLLVLPILAVWVVVLLATGYVGLATVLAGFALVPAAWCMDAPRELLVFVTLLALFMGFTHRGNIRRLLRGEELRFERARLLRRWRR